jgi:ATP-dependent Clp protease ATP-binding subunit ClpB
MISPDQLTLKAQQALQKAQQTARDRGNPQIESVHLLSALLDDKEGIVHSVLKKLGVAPDLVQSDVEEKLRAGTKVTGVQQIYASPQLGEVFESAYQESQSLKDEYVSVEHLLLSLAEDKSDAGDILRRRGVSRDNILKVLQSIRGGQRVTDQAPEDKYQALKRFGRDLNDLAGQTRSRHWPG